jgi:hypothetical protein
MGNLLLVKLVLVRSRNDLDQSGKFQLSFKTAAIHRSGAQHPRNDVYCIQSA